MGGVDLAVITHRLNVNPSFKPVKKKRSFPLEGQKAINEEVDKLFQAKAIREVEYPEWLANVVLVNKANGKWRLCIDFTYINMACPKDSFPLPRIDLIVRGGNRAGRAGPIVGRAKIGPVFSGQNFNSPARPKNRAGRAK